MVDFSLKMDNKQAEFETLSRATAALLEQHEKVRKDFDIELKKKADKAEADLSRKLKSAYKELSQLDGKIVERRNLIEKLEKDSSEKLKALTEQDKRLTREKAVISEIVSELNDEKKTLEGEKRLLSAEKDSLVLDITALRQEVSEIEQKKSEVQESLNVLELRSEESTIEHNFRQIAYDKEETDSKHRIAQINSQLNRASRSLHEVKVEEDNIRTDLANLSMQLDKREQTINGREAKVAQQEKRVFNYSKFTGL